MTYFLLSGNTLQIFSKNNQASLPFTQETIRFQEIVDRKLFETQIKDFFLKLKAGEAILFLSDDVTFAKTIEHTSDAALVAAANDFFATIPFQKDYLAKKIVRLKKQTILLAAHRDYYQTIVHIAQVHGWQIKHIVPLSLFEKLIAGKQINAAILSSLVKNKQILEEADFFQEYIIQEEKDVTTDKEDTFAEEFVEEGRPVQFNMKAQYIIAIICFLCFGAAIYYAYPILFPTVSPRTSVVPTTSTSIVPTIVPTITAEPTSGALGKADIRIDVLNGSGVAGQATDIKTVLSDAGFTQVDTGNASGTATESAITISRSVSKSVADELVRILKTSLQSVAVEYVASSDAYDVTITTGAPQ